MIEQLTYYLALLFLTVKIQYWVMRDLIHLLNNVLHVFVHVIIIQHLQHVRYTFVHKVLWQELDILDLYSMTCLCWHFLYLVVIAQMQAMEERGLNGSIYQMFSCKKLEGVTISKRSKEYWESTNRSLVQCATISGTFRSRVIRCQCKSWCQYLTGLVCQTVIKIHIQPGDSVQHYSKESIVLTICPRHALTVYTKVGYQ